VKRQRVSLVAAVPENDYQLLILSKVVYKLVKEKEESKRCTVIGENGRKVYASRFLKKFEKEVSSRRKERVAISGQGQGVNCQLIIIIILSIHSSEEIRCSLLVFACILQSAQMAV